jgi:predicted ATPase
MGQTTERSSVIRTPDQRLRVFVSSTLGELSEERQAARRAIERLGLSPVMFELGARPHPPRQLYRAYLNQSHVFVGIYWQRYGWVAPGEDVSGLEDEYRLADDLPQLIYIKESAGDREARLTDLLQRIKSEDASSYKHFHDSAELDRLLADDLAVLLAERFEASVRPSGEALAASSAPIPLTETLGRDREIEEVSRSLVDGARLLTLSGPGGVGKTRLALEIARRALDAFPGGVHFVPLAPITESELVVRTIADRLGVAVEGARSPRDALADWLAGQRTLLVLDNLEQVADAGGELVALLELCPVLQILATSRRALRVQGERDVPVAPLPLPETHQGASSLGREPAVRLFVDRALSVSPGFRLDDRNAGAVAELCRLLDGLPLAIELAAARTRVLPPQALLDRLNERFDALGEGSTDLPERQRTLRATVEWSHELLDEHERALFARLSVFSGGFYLEAAEAVCAVEGQDVLETLASLLDKSLLVVANDASGGEPRFQMLETVRRYASEHLDERGEADLLGHRHLDWYRGFAERAQPFLCGPGQREWAARLDPERANLRAAIGAAFDFHEDEAVIELVWDVIVFYFTRDAVYEPEQWMERVQHEGRPLEDVPMAKLRSLLTLMRMNRGEYGGAREALDSSLKIFRGRGMDFEAAVTLKELAWVRYLLDEDTEAAIDDLEESSRLFESIDHDWGVALSEIQLGSVLSASGRRGAAEARFERSLEHSRRIDNWPLIAQGLQQLAVTRIAAERYDEALSMLEEAAALLRRGGHQTETTSCLDALAAVALARGEADTAARALTVASSVRRKLSISLWPSAHAFVSQLTQATREALGGAEFDAIAAEAENRDPFEVLTQTLRVAV